MAAQRDVNRTFWPLGFMASLGIVSLAGVLVNNALILIDFIDTRLASGTPLRPAVIDAGLLRVHPILLTTLTTMGGLVRSPTGAGRSGSRLPGWCFGLSSSRCSSPSSSSRRCTASSPRSSGCASPRPAAARNRGLPRRGRRRVHPSDRRLVSRYTTWVPAQAS